MTINQAAIHVAVGSVGAFGKEPTNARFGFKKYIKIL